MLLAKVGPYLKWAAVITITLLFMYTYLFRPTFIPFVLTWGWIYLGLLQPKDL